MGSLFKLIGMGVSTAALSLTDNSVKEKIENGTINNGVIDKTHGFAEIEKHHNKGLPLNKLDKHTKEITFISSLVLGVQLIRTVTQAVLEDDEILDTANVLILAGAVSNTYDRIKRGYVVDYLKVGRKRAIYNFSDFMIIFGALLSLVRAFNKLQNN